MGFFSFPKSTPELREYDRRNRERRKAAREELLYPERIEERRVRKVENEIRQSQLEQELRELAEQQKEYEEYIGYKTQINRYNYLKEKYEGEY